MPPEWWLHRQRLEQAHHLIAKQQQAPAAVHLEVGFETLPHFSTAFKQLFGYTASSLASGTRTSRPTSRRAASLNSSSAGRCLQKPLRVARAAHLPYPLPAARL